MRKRQRRVGHAARPSGLFLRLTWRTRRDPTSSRNINPVLLAYESQRGSEAAVRKLERWRFAPRASGGELDFGDQPHSYNFLLRASATTPNICFDRRYWLVLVAAATCGNRRTATSSIYRRNHYWNLAWPQKVATLVECRLKPLTAWLVVAAACTARD